MHSVSLYYMTLGYGYFQKHYKLIIFHLFSKNFKNIHMFYLFLLYTKHIKKHFHFFENLSLFYTFLINQSFIYFSKIFRI